MKNILNFLRKSDIGEPPWDYYFLQNLDEKEYPKYLAKLFNYRTGEKLPLKYDFRNKSWIIDKKRCKTFNQKIQWIKLYGVTDLMRNCTDKVTVRDYVAEKIGSEYLKPVLQIIGYFEHNNLNKKDTSASNNCLPQYDKTITDFNVLSHSKPNVNSGVKHLYNSRYDDVSTYFDQIDFDELPNSSRVDFSLPKQDVTTYYNQIDWENLPNSFVIKCNHGCKWQYIIKDKEEFLQNKRLFEIVKKNIKGWLKQEYWCWNGFELQYKNIKQKLLIESYMENTAKRCSKIECYCFNGIPQIIIAIHNNNQITLYDKNFCIIDDLFEFTEPKITFKVNNLLNNSFTLSKILSKNFRFVRIDWIIFQNNLYFEEMTFSPYSGFHAFKNKENALYTGAFINLTGDKYEF